MKIFLNGDSLTIGKTVKIAREKAKVGIDPSALPRLTAARDYVDNVSAKKTPVYGINTGFGKFSDVLVNEKDVKLLQKNLLLSHACGVGQPFDKEIVRGMLALRINALVGGHSGVKPDTLELMAQMLNLDIIPIIPEKGSLGASGDLAPLSHMALPLLGLGEVFYKGKITPTVEAFAKAGLVPVELTAKEGLALINGTQAMCSISALAAFDALNLLKTADIVASLTVEALTGITDAFDCRIHDLRGQKGQVSVADNLRKLLAGSNLTSRQGELRVQDAYTLRCIPQIHGASRDSLSYVSEIVERELNAVTDNPLIFHDTKECFSGGNFHGQYLSMAADYLAIAAASLANVSERRVERLVNPQLSNGLPAFLVREGGLNSGFMIPQYVAAALVGENKVLCHPASVDSIPSSANQEDHVSMGMTAARKARTVIENVTNVLGIELFCACQAAELRGVEKLSMAGKAVFDLVRNVVPFIDNDVYMSPLIKKCTDLVRSGNVVKIVESIVGKLK
ncbi:MAG: histidine ammonia-lyase [Firmicutes bacterium]|nr:histidine ammonia-lyase [Bacillota bacterium]